MLSKKVMVSQKCNCGRGLGLIIKTNQNGRKSRCVKCIVGGSWKNDSDKGRVWAIRAWIETVEVGRKKA